MHESCLCCSGKPLARETCEHVQAPQLAMSHHSQHASHASRVAEDCAHVLCVADTRLDWMVGTHILTWRCSVVTRYEWKCGKLSVVRQLW